MFEILYGDRVVAEDIPKLSKTNKDRIRKTIEKKLTEQPEVFGKPLRRSQKGYRSLRVGDYRVIFRIHRSKVKIFVIQHRSVVYKTLTKRMK